MFFLFGFVERHFNILRVQNNSPRQLNCVHSCTPLVYKVYNIDTIRFNVYLVCVTLLLQMLNFKKKCTKNLFVHNSI